MTHSAPELFLSTFAPVMAFKTRGIPREFPVGALVAPEKERTRLFERLNRSPDTLGNWASETATWFDAFDTLPSLNRRTIRRIVHGLAVSLETITKVRMSRNEHVTWAEPTIGLARVYSPRSLRDMLANNAEVHSALGTDFRMKLTDTDLKFLTRAGILRSSPQETARVLPHTSSLKSWKQIDGL